ncbi:NADH-quinone oxidoreductase subunit J [Candidatus Deferrimicrobium sp.]|uniref:NADH-quinone oxidoreductase subunit J family protein n=1 Tax=Candidatus Deferrimicrobium sp. TaxID=3060586 RepID=UPI003C4CCBDB
METVLFILFGAVAVCGAVMVVTRKSPMASALYLILTLFAVAALFVLRQAHFLAAVQVIVYAGAVVVLFVFVIMLINVPEDRLPVERATTTRVLGVIAAGFFVLESAVLARRYWMPKGPAAEVGTVEAVGRALFTDYLLAFEITSVLLLAAVIGAIALAKRKI